ncbi:MAG: alginate export family protein, partial [Bryobacteraceae bacterium]
MSLILRFLPLGLLVLPLQAQWWDLPSRAAEEVTRESGNRFAITFEQRIRLEDRTDGNFGADPDRAAVLLRTRIGLTVRPVKWVKLSGMMQDSRAPGYGLNAPTNYRAPLGLHEAYVELTPGKWEVEAGRSMMHYGEGLMIGTPQWGNCSRSYDHARVAYVWRGL